jgi:hypothetical protein
VTEIEVDEVFGFMCNERSEVSTDDTVPGRTLALIELCMG